MNNELLDLIAAHAETNDEIVRRRNRAHHAAMADQAATLDKAERFRDEVIRIAWDHYEKSRQEIAAAYETRYEEITAGMFAELARQRCRLRDGQYPEVPAPAPEEVRDGE